MPSWLNVYIATGCTESSIRFWFLGIAEPACYRCDHLHEWGKKNDDRIAGVAQTSRFL